MESFTWWVTDGAWGKRVAWEKYVESATSAFCSKERKGVIKHVLAIGLYLADVMTYSRGRGSTEELTNRVAIIKIL